MATKARIAANIRYNKSRDSITIRPDKETGGRIRAAAAAAGMPIQRFLVCAALEKIDRGGEKS